MSIGEIILVALVVALLCIYTISMLQYIVEEIMFPNEQAKKFDIDIKDLDSEDDE